MAEQAKQEDREETKSYRVTRDGRYVVDANKLFASHAKRKELVELERSFRRVREQERTGGSKR